jgi:hypothetical protein
VTARRHGDPPMRATPPPIGRVRAATAYHFAGQAKGLIHEVRVRREPASAGLGGVLQPAGQPLSSSETPQAMTEAFLLTREYARARFPHPTSDLFDYSYAYELLHEQGPSSRAAGLPAAIAFLSVFLQQPVPEDVALAGVLVADPHDGIGLRPVADCEHAVKGAYNCNLRMIVLPIGNRNQLRASAHVPLAIQDELVRYAMDFDEAVRLVFGADILLTTRANGPAPAQSVQAHLVGDSP